MLERKKLSPERIPPAIEAKWSAEVLDEGFTPLPKRLLRCLSTVFTGPKAVKYIQVILAIVDYLRPNLSRGPSIEYLAFTAGLERKEFRKLLDELVEKGWVEIAGPEEALDIAISGLLNTILQETEEDES